MGLTTWRSGFDSRQGQRIFPLSFVSRSALRPAQPPVPRVTGVISAGVKRGRGVTLTTHLHLVPRSRMSKSYTSSPPPPSASMACRRTALLCFTCYVHRCDLLCRYRYTWWTLKYCVYKKHNSISRWKYYLDCGNSAIMPIPWVMWSPIATHTAK
jgi:hypothetical protein